MTGLLHDIYPEPRQGPATASLRSMFPSNADAKCGAQMLKSHLVCNATLAQLADKHGITNQLIAAPSALYATRAQTKTKGSMFESWIAALFYSYLKEQLPVPEVKIEEEENPWPKPDLLPQQAIEDDESTDGDESSEDELSSEDDEEGSEDESVEDGMDRLDVRDSPAQVQVDSTSVQDSASIPSIKVKSRGEAYDFIDSWLRPLFTPIAQFALESMRAEKKRLEALDAADSSVKFPKGRRTTSPSGQRRAFIFTLPTSSAWIRNTLSSGTVRGYGRRHALSLTRLARNGKSII